MIQKSHKTRLTKFIDHPFHAAEKRTKTAGRNELSVRAPPRDDRVVPGILRLTPVKWIAKIPQGSGRARPDSSDNVLDKKIDNDPHLFRLFETPMEPDRLNKERKNIHPEARGALELIAHGLQHADLRHESDRRHSLLSFDNAIEVLARVWVARDPKLKHQVEGLPPDRRASESIRLAVNGLARRNSRLNLDAIRHIHRIRNELYHEGKTLYPDRTAIRMAKDQACTLYHLLFDADPEHHLKTTEPETETEVSEQIGFLAEIQQLCNTLWQLADVRFDEALEKTDDGRLALEWKRLASLQDAGIADRTDDFRDLLSTRHNLILHGLSALRGTEARQLRKTARHLRNALDRYVSRVSILVRAKSAYATSPFRDDIVALELVFRGDAPFVVAHFEGGETKEDDLSHMIGEPDCVSEVVRVRTTRKDLNGQIITQAVEPKSIKTVKVGKLFEPRLGMRRALATLWDLDDLSFAEVVGMAARSDLSDGLPGEPGKRKWPAAATHLEANIIGIELLDPIHYNPTPFIDVRLDFKAAPEK